ncbi:group III truncated hemoglobin [Herminiimonas sp. CN]|uniref:group III truncated hemoglobin n=1 Tax=Herminiimonas sp. CN TaxID=1349818 RepID=UPI000473196E|nr:group III truncated hemoglobin [Herminiimonas sp. CN]
MATPELCTEQEISRMVHDFYDRVRLDEVLGPIFNGHISDWDHHLAKLVDFWSSILRGTGRFSGTPMPKHTALPGLNAELFRRWLSLFHETTQALDNQAMREQADSAAQRIAQSLWYGYQMSRNADQLPAELHHD